MPVESSFSRSIGLAVGLVLTYLLRDFGDGLMKVLVLAWPACSRILRFRRHHSSVGSMNARLRCSDNCQTPSIFS